MGKTSVRDPNSVLDWVFDLDAWMLSTDSIASHEIILTNAAGLTVDSSSHAGPFLVKNSDGTERTITTGVRVELSGGTAGSEPSPTVTARVTTAQGRVKDFTWTFPTREQ